MAQQLTRAKSSSLLLCLLTKLGHGVTLKRPKRSHAMHLSKFLKNISTNNTNKLRQNVCLEFGSVSVKAWTKRKLNWSGLRYFCLTSKQLVLQRLHLLPWTASACILYYYCLKHIPLQLRAKTIQCAKCDTAYNFPLPQTVLGSKLVLDDRDSFIQWLIRDFIPLGFRAAQLFCFFTPLLLAYPLTYVSPKWFEVWLRVLYLAVEYSGATFIKLGQWASTRRDLFSKQVCDRFAHLHFQVRPHAWSHTAHILKEAYGELWQEMLHLVEGQSPIGSGCIAQVYKGYISEDLASPHSQINDTMAQKDPSSQAASVIPVAIKVLHPNIQDMFKRDMILMAAAARFLTWLFPKLHWVNLNQCVQEFKVVMQAQLDMRQECFCLQKFTEDFASFDQIRVPKPFPKLVRHNILVETFEEGVSVGQIVQDKSQPAELKAQLASIGVNILLQMVFVNNFVHADLHPGNLLVQNMDKFDITEEVDFVTDSVHLDEPVEDYRQVPCKKDVLRLVLLDCGITSSLEPEDREKFQEVFTAVVKGEGETVADLFLSKSAVNHCKDPILFRIEMAQLVKDARQNLVSISKIKVAELMNSVFTVLSRHKIQLEANFATIILAMAMLEGLGRSLDPDLDLLEKARPVLLGSYFSAKNAGA